MKLALSLTDRPEPEAAPTGRHEARYLAFLETITNLRPSLHRYCARMTGSVLDGEDVVQEALFQAYRNLDTFDDGRPLGPWLFRIAHNRCVDFLRRQGARDEAEAKAAVDESDTIMPVEPIGPALGRAVEHLVLMLPPKERACVLLKDVFDYSLEEIADLVDSTVGGVKAALNRGRSKLTQQPAATRAVRPHTTENAELLRLYVERFNQRDWIGLRELIAADARLSVADRWVGRLADSPYFGVYAGLPEPWRLAVGEVDGEPAVIIMQVGAGGLVPTAMVRLRVSGGRIVEITDYWYCPWLIAAPSTLLIDEASCPT